MNMTASAPSFGKRRLQTEAPHLAFSALFAAETLGHTEQYVVPHRFAKIEDLVLQLHKTKTKHDITSCKKETLHE